MISCPHCDHSPIISRRDPKEGDTRKTFGRPMVFKNGEWVAVDKIKTTDKPAPTKKPVEKETKPAKPKPDTEIKKTTKPAAKPGAKQSKSKDNLDLTDRPAMLMHFRKRPNTWEAGDPPPKFERIKSPAVHESIVGDRKKHLEGEPIHTTFFDDGDHDDTTTLEQALSDKRFSKHTFSTFASNDWWNDPVHQEGNISTAGLKWNKHWRDFEEGTYTDPSKATKGWLKTRRDELAGKEDPEFKAFLDSAPKYEGDCFRGMALDDMSGFKVGGEFKFGCSSSASIDPNTACSFAGFSKKQNVLLVIRSKTAADTTTLNKTESEVVLRKDAKYKIKRISTVDRDIKHRGNRHYDTKRERGLDFGEDEPGTGTKIPKGTKIVVIEET